MSTTVTPDSEPFAPRAVKRTSLLRWIAGSAGGAAVVAAVALAAWPASESDKARDDGRAYGEAVAALYAADSPAEVEAALADVHTAASDARVHAGDAVGEHVAAQEDALARAADGFAGVHTTDDAFEAELYEAELDVALDDLAEEASDFRAQGPEVQRAFWDGFEEGMPSS
jgi:hypothetical protein